MVGVWLGKHNNTPTKRLSGYGAAAPFVKAIFSELHPDRDDGLNNVSFNPPQGYKPYMISTLSGALAPPNFPYATRGWFKPGSSPEVNDMPYKILPIDIRNGLLASPLCSKKFVKYNGLSHCLFQRLGPERGYRLHLPLTVNYVEPGQNRSTIN